MSRASSQNFMANISCFFQPPLTTLHLHESFASSASLQNQYQASFNLPYRTIRTEKPTAEPNRFFPQLSLTPKSLRNRSNRTIVPNRSNRTNCPEVTEVASLVLYVILVEVQGIYDTIVSNLFKELIMENLDSGIRGLGDLITMEMVE